MKYLAGIQISAQLASLMFYGLLAVWFVAPWLRRLNRVDALIVIATTHVFRYFEAVAGDVVGAVTALAAVWALCYRWSGGIALSWVLAVATLADFGAGIRRKALEPLWGLAGGTTWLLLNFYVPLLMVSLPLLVWQLYTRRGEPMVVIQVSHVNENGVNC